MLVGAVFIIGLVLGSNLPGLSINGPKIPYSTNVRVYFSTHESCTAEVVQLIDGSNSTIYIAVSSFTNQDIANAILRASKRGVAVSIIAESSSRVLGSMFSLVQRNTTAKVVFSNKSGMMHDSFMVVDGVYVTTGSFTWTNDAETVNAENMLMLTDRNIASLYTAEWNWLLVNRT